MSDFESRDIETRINCRPDALNLNFISIANDIASQLENKDCKMSIPRNRVLDLMKVYFIQAS
jgi:hypothetical protein